MEHNQKVEDYMRIIYRLRENGLVRGAYIARELGVTKPTVSVALKEMEAAGYLAIQKKWKRRVTWLFSLTGLLS